MKKNIWIWNHYATNMYKDKAGRHYSFAKNLNLKDYKATIFAATSSHNTRDNINTADKKFIVESDLEVPFVFVKTPSYSGNGKQRILNMLTFYKNLFPVAKKYAEIHGKPDVIIASSVHPLTLVAGIKIAKRFGIPCICEVRDLWPESLVAYGSLKKESIVTKILYQGEKWIYAKADKLIFTMEGGKDYIIDKGWSKASGGPVDVNKVYHINNGVDLQKYDYNKENYSVKDMDLNNENIFKVVYAGSIRKVNKVGLLLDAAKSLKNTNIKFLIWGDGDQVDILQKRIIDEEINNVSIKGKVEKKFIPYITSKADLNIISGTESSLYKYGPSLNKMFEYFAAGRPVLNTKTYGFSPIKKYKAGIELKESTAEKVREGILYFRDLKEIEYNKYSLNSREAASDYDFPNLTSKLINIIEK